MTNLAQRDILSFIMARIRWRGFCKDYDLRRWISALVVLIIFVALCALSSPSPTSQSEVLTGDDINAAERIHVMIVMCNKHDNRKAKGEVMVLCVSLDIRCQTITLFAPNTSNIFENTKFALMMNS